MSRKKVLVIVLCAVAGVVLFVGALFAILRYTFPELYYRIYPFDRIAGTVSVTADGEPYPLKPGSVSAEKTGFRTTPHVSSAGNGALRVRIRGGDKASYGFTLEIDGVDQPIHIGTFHYNWWDVTQFDIAVSVDMQANTVTFRCAAKVIGSDGEWIPAEDIETVSLSDPEIRFGFGLN